MKSKIKEQAVRIFLGDGEDEIIIDYRDLVFLAANKFYVTRGRGQSKYLKANVTEEGKHTTIDFHRAIMGKTPGLEIDHINRNGLDNRRANLRFVTHKQNQSNLPNRLTGTSKYRGVSWSTVRKKWTAFITNNGKTKNIGGYKSQIEAAVAFDNYVLVNGLDRQLNFP